MKRSKSIEETDWNLCFLCQKHSKEKLRSTSEGINKLANNLSEFYKLDGLDINTLRISSDEVNGVPNFNETLHLNKAQYHKLCALKYNQRELFALKKRLDKTKAQNKELPTSSNRSRISVKPLNLGSFQCCFCGKEDEDSNLHAAGTYHA